ncbi:hypothetical protein BH23ACT7_BH23ACT7_25900 [soil metagenome]|nr:hypothetical protein [Euzebyaceae bacterium]
MNDQTVTIKVPPIAAHLAVLRTAVGGIAARDRFTLDQVDDLRMAVEEAATQLLRHSGGSPIVMDVTPTDSGLEVRLSADVPGDVRIIDESSFSWMILRALADDLSVESLQTRTTVVLGKKRLAMARDAE